MTPKETTTIPKTNTAMMRGIFLFKCYGIIYVILIILYFIHAFTGSIKVPITGLKGGERFFKNQTFIGKNGEHLEYSAGTELELEMVKIVHSSAVEGQEKLVPIHRKEFYYNLPWPMIFGIWNFLGLVLLLYTVAGDALPRMLEAHSKAIARELAEAREAMRKSEELIRNYKDLLVELKQERVRLRLKTDEEANAEHNHIIQRTKDDVERMRRALERHLEARVQSATDRLRREISDEVIHRVREEMPVGVDEETHNCIVADFTAEIKGMKLP